VLCRCPEFMNEYFVVLGKHEFGVAQKTTKLVNNFNSEKISIFIISFVCVRHFLILFDFSSQNNTHSHFIQ